MSKGPLRHPESAYKPVAGEGGLVVLPSRSEIKVLNPVATLVFELLDGQHSIEAIVQRVVDEFDVTAEQADRDVREFLETLESHGMLASGDADRQESPS